MPKSLSTLAANCIVSQSEILPMMIPATGRVEAERGFAGIVESDCVLLRWPFGGVKSPRLPESVFSLQGNCEHKARHPLPPATEYQDAANAAHRYPQAGNPIVSSLLR